jgi:hypothetical protein
MTLDPNPRTDVIQPQRNAKPLGDAETLPAESGRWIKVTEIGEAYSVVDRSKE